MKLENIKLVVTDMDGTLLNSKHELTPTFFETYNKLKRNNIKFIAASGRQYYSIADKFESILDEITIIAENGAYIRKNGTEILVKSIHIDLLKKVIEYTRTLPNIYIVLCGKTKAYIEQKEENFVNFFKEFYNKYEIVDNLLDNLEDDYFKIALYNPYGAEENIYPFFEKFSEELQIKISGEFWVDIMQLNVNKGTAINLIQNAHNISKDETLVFGDYLNDLEMFQNAGISVAMKNAHPKIKEIASYITESNDEKGVEVFINKLA
ncbi:HAD family hydrolase [Flavobacterium haoranii]|uniref:Sugar-phosphatase n=1 Tax=Flavobacterium haoranii TaxID=683124 RepID=A0A1M6B6Z9_9FLAO|nr:HAD family hydrolase [Flavobacterium haoranii]SHI44427.1 hypothetical protein SAMN05444337_0015 [Flavobacterium haoranii]